ncbi:unnamed protein product [Ixodes pacificus]
MALFPYAHLFSVQIVPCLDTAMIAKLALIAAEEKRLRQVLGDMFHLKKTRPQLIKVSDEGMNIPTKHCTLSEGNELAYATSPSKCITTSVSACITKQYAQYSHFRP